MDDEAHPEPDLHHGTTDEGEPEENESPGAVFSHSQHFVVTGGNFTTITNINRPALTVPPDFRRLPMGDLDLRAEIYLDEGNSVVYRRGKQASARRIYSARIPGVDSKMTVAVYQGSNAEEEWREHIQRHSWLRHPNFVQIYGTAGSSGIHAAVFHDDLVPATKLFEKHHESHFATEKDYIDASHYYQASGAGTYLVRNSLKRFFCIFTPRIIAVPDSAESLVIYEGRTGTLSLSGDGTSSLFEPPDHSQIIKAISMKQYHELCGWYLAQYSWPEVSTNTSIRLGSVVYMPRARGDREIAQEVAYLSDPPFEHLGWRSPSNKSCHLLESGWTRVILGDDTRDTEFNCQFDGLTNTDDAWLAQANHIFDCAKIRSNYRDYGLIYSVEYQLRLSDKNDIPHGYSFLCPSQDLQGSSPSEFRYPACPAYWSLDPSGSQRLDSEEAHRLGFPSFTMDMFVLTRLWDDFVYTGIREFHQAKGFDPYSQDVVRELGYPLFEVRVPETGGVPGEVQNCDEVPSGAFCEEVTSQEPTDAFARLFHAKRKKL
ncbi:hypothetical protein C8J57DRAFT_1533586 [Mycena rebaudengoi]|nr:hypothetical protein C8J57DRAFT_1533586 [Mycena rebaudengoi]